MATPLLKLAVQLSEGEIIAMVGAIGAIGATFTVTEYKREKQKDNL